MVSKPYLANDQHDINIIKDLMKDVSDVGGHRFRVKSIRGESVG